MKLALTLITIGYLVMDLITGQSLPGKPTDIHVLADTFNIGVQWEPPNETFGTITNYIVSFTILPNNTEFFNIVNGQDNISIIAVGTHIGRLYKIRVGAQNDVGIGQYSDARYIRINCSETYDVYPNTSVELTSPGYETGDILEAGVICSWTLKTNPLYIIEVEMVDIKIDRNTTNVDTSENCFKTSAYVNVEGVGRFCDEHKVLRIPKRSNLNVLTVTLKTGLYAKGRGFKLKANSVLRLPGPPRNIQVTTTDHAVIITWQQPIENTLPVTSFVIRYNVINKGHSYRIPISSNMRRFSLNVHKYEGQLLQINMSAAIGFEEGQESRSFFVRAPCIHKSTIPMGQSLNISSPNYPKEYPKSIVCTWVVTSDPETELYVTFLDFRLEDTSFCSNDYVLFSFKENREPDCSRIKTPRTINTKTPAFNITFVTDEKNQFEGFELEITSKGKRDKTTTVPSETKSKPTSTDTNKSTFNDMTKFSSDELSKSTNQLTKTRGPFTSSFSLVFSTIPSGTFTRSSVTSIKGSLPTINHRPTSTSIYYNDGGDPGSFETLRDTSSIKYLVTTDAIMTENQQSIDSRTKRTDVTSTTLDSLSKFTKRLDRIQTSRESTPESNRLETMTTIKSAGFDQISGNLTDITTTSKEIEHIDVGSSNIDMGTIVGCVVAALVALVVCFGLHRYRKQKLKTMKISYDGSVRYKRGHVELHDIINLPDLKTGKNYETFNVTKIQETSFINSKKSAKKKDSTHRTRQKHNSFPSSFSKRKIHQDIQRTLSAFRFIEDKATLETQIRRKQCRNRTYSL